MKLEGYNTKKKQEILQFLKSSKDRALTVDEIYTYLINKDIKINITTIYRYLEKLMQANRLMKFASDDNKKHTYQYVENKGTCIKHLHLQCSECNKVIHLDCNYMDEMMEHISKYHHFNLSTQSAILYGKCEECQRKDKS